MASEFNTSVRVKGTQEEYAAILEVLAVAAVDQKEQYRRERNCWYLDTYALDFYCSAKTKGDLEEQVRAFIEGHLDSKGWMQLSFSGPYGIINGPFFDHTIDLFERMADAAPNCRFEANMGGWNPGAEEAICAELKNGKLRLKYYYHDFFEACDEWDEDEDFDNDFDDEDDGDENLVSEEIYDPVTKTYTDAKEADAKLSVSVTVKLFGNNGRDCALTMQSTTLSGNSLTLNGLPSEFLAANTVEALIELLCAAVDGVSDAKASAFKQQIREFGQQAQAVIGNDGLSKAELLRVHEQEAIYFDWLRTAFLFPEYKKLAKKVVKCAERNKAKNIEAFKNYIESETYFFPACEYSEWPNFCNHVEKTPLGNGRYSVRTTRNPDAKVMFDWTGAAANIEEFAQLICSKETPEDYSVERVVIAYVNQTTEQTAVYMPGGPERKATVVAVEVEEPAEVQNCKGLTFVITGKVNHFDNRDAFKEYVEAHGGKVAGSVSKNTNYLVNNDSESTSSKNKKAKELGVPVITEAEFIEKFGK